MWNLLKMVAQQAADLGTDVYLVGGAVRDLLWGLRPRDLDLAVANGALDLARRMADRHRGTLVVLDGQRQMARVVFKQDYQLDFSPFKGAHIEGDLRARDFTINAMALHLNSLCSSKNCTSPADQGWRSFLVDPTGGKRDLQLGLLQATGNEALLDDPLRVIRGVRLAAQFNLSITPETVVLMRQGARRIEQVAGERIWQELGQALTLPHVHHWVEFMDRELNLWQYLLPGRLRMEATEQNYYHVENVWRHCLRTFGCLEIVLKKYQFYHHLAGGATGPAVFKLAALLHDVGKPDTAKIRPDGRISFYGHAQAGVPYAEALADRLRLSGMERQYLVTLIRHHMQPLHYFLNKGYSDLKVFRLFRLLEGNFLDILILSLADVTATYTASERLSELTAYREYILKLIHRYEHEPEFFHPAKLLSGKDLIALGVPEGPLVGKFLARLAEMQITGAVTDLHSAKQWVIAELKNITPQ